MKLIVGLGNPGTQYDHNRHNVGSLGLDEIARAYATSPWRRKFQGLVADARIAGERTLLLKPQTYMNESGRSVGEAARYLKIEIEDVIVLYDEIDLSPAKLKVKTGGGNAGHNGLKSISAHLGNDYVRVRIGVGHPGDRARVANYVLSDFSKADMTWLTPLLEEITKAFPHLIQDNPARFLNDVVTALKPAAAEPKTKKPRPENPPATKTSQPPAKGPAPPSPSPFSQGLKNWLNRDGDNDT